MGLVWLAVALTTRFTSGWLYWPCSLPKTLIPLTSHFRLHQKISTTFFSTKNYRFEHWFTLTNPIEFIKFIISINASLPVKVNQPVHLWQMQFALRGCSHITSAGRGGVGKCWPLLTRGGGGQKFFQQKEFKGTKNVGRKNNWFKSKNIC